MAKDFPKAIVQIFKEIFKRLLFDLRGVIKKFSSRKLSLSNIFFMAKVLFGFNQDLSLVLEVLAFHLDSRQNIFTWEMTFENLLEICTMVLENPLPLSIIPSCHGLSANPLS